MAILILDSKIWKYLKIFCEIPHDYLVYWIQQPIQNQVVEKTITNKQTRLVKFIYSEKAAKFC